MSFYALLKALRIEAKPRLSRKELVQELRKQGVRTSVNSIERMEHGENKAIALLLTVLHFYSARAKITPGRIESALFSHVGGESMLDRRRRFIANKIKDCNSQELAEIEEIIDRAES